MFIVSKLKIMFKYGVLKLVSMNLNQGSNEVYRNYFISLNLPITSVVWEK